MKYKLNKTPLNTTNGFKINDIDVELDAPSDLTFHDYETNIRNVKVYEKESFISDIGLEHSKYISSEINFDSNLNENIYNYEYLFKNKEVLIDEINIYVDDNIDKTLIIKYESVDTKQNFHNGKINVNAADNSTLNLIIFNNMNNESTNIQDIKINTKNNSSIKVTLIDLNGSKRIYRGSCTTNRDSRSEFKMCYIGKEKDLIDINLNYVNNEPQSENNILVEGILTDSSIKHFKGTIDFVEGSTKSIGNELENTIILSDSSISKSLPMLLCHEEDVIGSHGVSSGCINKEKLFYLMTRGLTEAEAKKTIVVSNFNKIIDSIPELFKKDIEGIINEKIEEIL